MESVSRPAPPALTVRMKVRSPDPGQAPVAAYRMLRGAMGPDVSALGKPQAGSSMDPPLAPTEAQELPVLERSYLPRELLSRGPLARDVVLLQWPLQAPMSGSFRGELRLFIDEQGVVRRVEAADDGLPEILLEAARQAFQDTRFSPGELQGRTVRSVIRVEVSFENGPLNVTP